jgi:hypothetical protein
MQWQIKDLHDAIFVIICKNLFSTRATRPHCVPLPNKKKKELQNQQQMKNKLSIWNLIEKFIRIRNASDFLTTCTIFLSFSRKISEDTEFGEKKTV